MAWKSIIFLLMLLSCWQARVVFACRYTVRDVAFVDLGDAPYRLFVFAGPENEDLAGELEAAVERIAEAELLNANTVIEFVDLSPEIDHPALKYANKLKLLPALVAVGPEQEPLIIKEGLGIGAATASDELHQLCRTFVDSAARREMFSKLPGVHSVILILDGADTEANRTTHTVIQQTLPQVEQSLEFLPKPIKAPPHVIHLSATSAADERVLLWSLGMDPEPTDATQVALLFGRGRKLGPILRFPEDPQRRLIRSLAVVGQDCECGLDRRWMQGAMVPHRWSADDEKRAIQELGFDPGNPLVKAEIDRILTRGPGADGEREVALEDALKITPALSYQEIALDDLVTDEVAEKSEIVASNLGSSEPLNRLSSISPTDDEEGEETSTILASAPPEMEPQVAPVENAERSGGPDMRQKSFSPPGNWSYLLLIGSALVVVTIGLCILLRSGEGSA